MPFSFALGTALYKNEGVNATTGRTRDGLMRDAIDNLLSNTARGMTNWLRSFFASPFLGQNEISEVYIVVRWPYLIFLGDTGHLVHYIPHLDRPRFESA
ncbi:hypothetical protein TSTA_050800 [Talaromyces stipitatus ATCC 10500]|uniref:Uncharacterized protein n=1 Tax=Talaromyces stipitatus (strain ATCC 10500 / CBS 375.48 / QM 6759 / NRRL 1006) TaxID=441959 RepID=B8MIY0_TALSN|nr:uncharacterized protein TSTA_050800 [Talaromyces stipitatus ATCC 10500]EED15642.1 hypothetical protein TSTA_050800 [Talaromyces stipitatus ATCC 10500]